MRLIGILLPLYSLCVPDTQLIQARLQLCFGCKVQCLQLTLSTFVHVIRNWQFGNALARLLLGIADGIGKAAIICLFAFVAEFQRATLGEICKWNINEGLIEFKHKCNCGEEI